MNRLTLTAASVVVFAGGLGLAAQTPAKRSAAPQSAAPAQPKPAMAVAHAPAAPPAEAQTALVKQYCAGCHSDKGKAGQLSLASFDVAQVADHADVGEKMVRKLRAGMMPPPGARRPDAEALKTLAVALETRIDARRPRNPNPGRRMFQR